MEHQALEVEPKSKIRLMWEHLEVSICMITMSLMVVIVFAQVVGRYVFNYSFSWSEEIARFLMVWITFAGSAYAFRMGAHIGVTVIVERMPRKIGAYIKLLARVLTIIFFLVLGYYGWHHTVQQYVMGQVAPATRIPVAIPYSAVPIGSFLVIIRLIDQAIHDYKNRHGLGAEYK
ncbi:MAG: TRAP transporter small permease [Bacillota bacterium]|nr:TRAP transporter small permease [Bacillota bacterium]